MKIDPVSLAVPCLLLLALSTPVKGQSTVDEKPLSLPSAVGISKMSTKELLRLAGNCYYVQHKIPEALVMATEVLARSKDAEERASALALTVDCQMAAENYVEALKKSNLLIAQLKAKTIAGRGAAAVKVDKSGLALAHWHKQRCQFMMGDYVGALDTMKYCTTFGEPGNIGYLEQRARIYEKLKRYPEALSDLTEILNKVSASAKVEKVSSMYNKRTIAIKVLYQRAKIYKLLGKTDLSELDVKEGNRLSEEL